MNAGNSFRSFSKKRTILFNGIRLFSRPKNNCQNLFLSQTHELCRNIQESKNYSTESDEKKSPKNIKLPPLMNFPRVIWPSILRSFKNSILSYFIIKPYMDYDFDLNEFVLGSKKAVHVVSKKLSSGEELNELVTDDIIPVLQSRLSVMSAAQREWLAIDEEDIYFSFPYQVGIMFNDDENDQKRFVEILMVHHSLKGLGEMKSRGEEIPLNIGFLPEYRNRICIANYRFIREYTKGVKDDWTINLLNHFKPADEIEQN